VQMGVSGAGTSLQKRNPINHSPTLQSKNCVLLLAIVTKSSAGFIFLQQPSASPEGPVIPCKIETTLKDIIIFKKTPPTRQH